MELLLNINRALHIVAGISTLVAGPIAIFYNFRNPKNHRIAGQIFFWAMTYVTFGGAFAILRKPENTFYQFLFFLAFFTMLGVGRGVRAMQFFKGKTPFWVDKLIFSMQTLNGLAMIGLGTSIILRGGDDFAVGILLAVFGSTCLTAGVGFWRRLGQFGQLDRRVWYRMHIADMIGGFTASTTAFVVQTCHFLPWWAQFFGPTLILTPITILFLRRLKLGRNDFSVIREA